MLWESIKKILQKQKGTCIIIEEGKPAYVVMSFDEFENSLDAKEDRLERSVPSPSEQELLERINQDIINWKEAQAQQEASETPEEDKDEVKIEDLPL